MTAAVRPLLALAAAAAAFLALGLRSEARTLIRVQADRVAFYYDRFVLEADGNVRVSTSDGMTISGDAFSMDLKLNRFLLAGHVHVADAAGAQDGAALADYLDFDRIYLVPLTTAPDRWTFVGGDFAHPVKGRDMPGDTFFFPDLGSAKPYMTTRSAVVGEKSFVRFGSGQFDVSNGGGLYIPVPSYYVNFSADPHLGDNSLSGANYDATWEFTGGANAISALHFRYDTVNKTYLSFEQHLSGPKAYAVFSLNPITRPSKFWNLLLSDQPSDHTQFRSFTQLHTFQYGLSRPLESQQVTTVQATQALSRSFLTANWQFENFSMLVLGCYLDRSNQQHCTSPNHPAYLQLGWQTFDQPLTPFFHGARLYGHLSAGIGFLHDAYPLQMFGGTNYQTIWQHQAGFELYMPHLRIGNSPLTYQNMYLDLSFNKQRQWNSVPHYVDTAQTKMSLSKSLDRFNHMIGFLDYTVQNTGDYYGAQQSLVYPSFVPLVNGVPVPGYAAFRGIATQRTLSLGLQYSNQGDFSAFLLARRHTDFPAPFPGLFGPPLTNVLGQIQGDSYLGQPPYDLTGEIRMRINPHMSIDISRTYYFNYGNQGWSPQFVFQVLQ